VRRFAAVVVILIAGTTLNVAAAADPYVKLTDVRVAMNDGVPLASDIYVPTIADGDGDGLYPCVVELTPYRKETRAAEGAGHLPAQGIALIETDARGTGGSGGEYDIVFSVREQADAAAMIEWAATSATKDGAPLADDDSNKLCEETVGMYGGSYSGIIQYLVASLPEVATGDLPAAPPHLATVAPQRAYGDLYRDIVYHGGVAIGSFGQIWSGGTSAYYVEPPTDVQSEQGSAAWTDHLTKNDPMIVNYLMAPYADAEFSSNDSDPGWTQKLYEDSSILPRIQNLRVPTLHLAGWFDAFTRGQLMTFTAAREQERANSSEHGPNYLIIGPWNHGQTHFINPNQGFREDLVGWYRYWLEDRVNGGAAPSWMSGQRMRYFQMRTGVLGAQSAADGEWKTTDQWPPADLSVQRFYLRADGRLSTDAPTTSEAEDLYALNPSAGTAETLSRWDNAAGTPQPQWDQRLESGKGLTYQTAPLAADFSIAGPIGFKMFASVLGAERPPTPADGPVLQATPPYNDTDFVVKVSDVAADGTATLLTQGYLRASHRTYDLSRSIVADGEILAPYHLHTAAALDPPPPGEVREYQIEIWPTAKTFGAGHSIRVDITSSDTPNHLTLTSPTLNSVYHDAARASYLSIPVAPQG